MEQTKNYLKPVAMEKAYRLLNVGGTGMISAEYNGETGMMPATWVCALDIMPFKATAVIDKSHFTRPLIEKSGYFAIALPTLEIIEETMYLGSVSKYDVKDKIEKSGAEIFTLDGCDIPLMKGCAAYMIFKLIPEEHNQQAYDLFIGECVKAYADERVFKNRHWIFEQADPKFSTIHYVAGNHFYSIGKAYDTKISI